MANNERLTKRVKKIEDWVAENEEMGGPKGYLDTMVALINETRRSQQAHAQLMNNFNNLKSLLDRFLVENEMGEEWNKFLEDEENAVQKQSTKEVPVRDESETSEEVSEEDAEGDKTTK
jgi:archaellum biogenesis protein FlaJ (TadC family)